MKKMRFLSVMLCLALLASLLAAPALADDSTGSSAEGLVINKTAVYNAETNDYTITLEAYATGSKIISTEKKDVPTDIVLVLDQSGSMAGEFEKVTKDTFVPYGYRKNSENFKNRYQSYNSQGNLWYEQSDGSYVSVSITSTSVSTGQYVSTANWNNGQYYAANESLWEKDGNDYKQVTVSKSGYKKYTYTYTKDDTKSTSSGDTTVPDHGSREIFYYKTKQDYKYTYSIQVNGKTTEIGSSIGADTIFEVELYEKVESGSTISKLKALKNAVRTFVNSVNEKAKGADGVYGTEDDVNHRIAVVGFATGDYSKNNSTYPKYGNTELFIGSTQYNYNVNASSYYSKAFQDMNTEAGYNNVIASNNALDAVGATHVDLGVEMANGIFKANPVTEGEKRNRVMIVFTDGAPSEWIDYSTSVANAAISKAKTTKENYKATVYTIGIFSGADATSAGNSSGNDTEKSNCFMQNLSSNNGTVQNPSYYLSAADSSSLTNIFQQISDQIESGGSSTTLGAETVIKDIIAPQFELPEGTTVDNITLETYACTGKNGDEYIWTKNDTAMGATATVNGDKVDVTGFDFSKNWCGTETTNGNVTYRGNKLVISFTVKAKDAFLGGNDVFTNTSAGVYENAAATEPVATFNRPQVNVPIKDVTVTAQDKNVYLLGSLTGAQIKKDTTIKSGDVDITDPTKLEAWQTEYADVTITYTDASGNTVTDLKDLKDDVTYTITATVAPKTTTPTSTEGETAVTKSDSKEQHINVFKPELTFKDGQVDYMSVIGGTTYKYNGADKSYGSDNYDPTETQWKHGDTLSTAVTMIGTAPTLNMTYAPTEGVDASNKVTATDYVPVKVTVKIGNDDVTTNTTFKHDTCSVDGCQWDDETMKDGAPAFLLHVENVCADLTIKKVANGVAADPGQSFLFTITGPNNYTNEVIIVGNGFVTIKDLQIGTYTVTEDTSWSWRYEPVGEAEKSITLVANQKNEVVIENERTDDKWLDGNTSVDNVFKGDSIEKNPTWATN